MSELDDQVAADADLWQAWQEAGVTESTTLTVDFDFYTRDWTAAEQVADALRGWGLTEIEIKKARTLLFFRRWEICGVEVGTWSLIKLQERTKRHFELAEKLHVRYGGHGAIMPDKV
jgi:hypothetical protein